MAESWAQFQKELKERRLQAVNQDVDVDDLCQWPLLGRFLGHYTDESGRTVRPGTLTIFVEDGKWKGCLRDRFLSLVGFVTVPDLFRAFDIIEEAMKAGEIDWRKEKGGKS